MVKTLIVIDVQKAIDDPKWGVRNNPHAEKHMVDMLAFWRQNGGPIIHIQHNSTEPESPYRPGQPLHDFKPEVVPNMGERVISKSTNNAFVGTDLEAELQGEAAHQLVICGVLTQHSVDCTARMAASLGYDVTVISDATAATAVTDLDGKFHSADDVHNLTLAHLGADYAAIKTAEELFVEGS